VSGVGEPWGSLLALVVFILVMPFVLVVAFWMCRAYERVLTPILRRLLP
jgi:hypothetical protein